MNNQKHILLERSDRFAGVYPCGCFGRCMCFYKKMN
jgi:hypothetical protein